MRRILAGSLGLALGLGAFRVFAQEPMWQSGVTPSRKPAVTLGPPTVALGAPRALPAPPADRGILPASLNWTAPQRVVRAQVDDKSPMPPGPTLPGAPANGSTPLPPPTPLGGTAPVPSWPPAGGADLGGPIASGPVVAGPGLPGAPYAPCPTGPACDPCLAPLPGGAFVPDAHPAGYLFYGSAEYLLWWIRGANVPALLVTGTPLPNFNIGNPVTLFGDGPITGQERSGGRFTLGWWFTPCQNWGVEGSYFFLGTRNGGFEAANPGTGVLARPFLNPDLTSNSEILAFPGLSMGSFIATTQNSLWGADINLKKNLCLGCNWRVDLLTGFRYLHFDERLDIGETFMGVPGGPFAGVSGMVLDQFKVTNNFYGGQVGLSSEWRRGPWSVNLLTKVALGSTHQTIDIAGAQTILAPAGNAIPGTFPGLLAQPTNIGQHSRDAFAVVPEVGLNVGWQATSHLKLFVGYTFLYWSNVVRAGDQIDPVLDVVPSRLNGQAVPPLVQRPGAMHPVVPFKETDFWAQGVNLGLQWTW
jgi:hypothetical protein